jgi:hypothetical protein
MTLNRGLSLRDRGGPAGYSLTNREKNSEIEPWRF